MSTTEPLPKSSSPPCRPGRCRDPRPHQHVLMAPGILRTRCFSDGVDVLQHALGKNVVPPSHRIDRSGDLAHAPANRASTANSRRIAGGRPSRAGTALSRRSPCPTCKAAGCGTLWSSPRCPGGPPSRCFDTIVPHPIVRESCSAPPTYVDVPLRFHQRNDGEHRFERIARTRCGCPLREADVGAAVVPMLPFDQLWARIQRRVSSPSRPH